mgnify:CR=1 FL=1
MLVLRGLGLFIGERWGFRLINFYRGTLGVPLVLMFIGKRWGFRLSATSGMVQSARLKKGTGGRRLRRRPLVLSLRPPAHHSARLRAESQSFPLFYPIRFTIPQNALASSGNPIFPLFPLCATHHSARLRAESQSFPLIYPYTVHHSAKRVSVERNPNHNLHTIPQKRVSVERELWFAKPPPCGANSTAQTPRSAISPARRCCHQNKTRRSNPRGGRSRRWQSG